MLLDAQPLFESVSTSPLSELKHGWLRGGQRGNVWCAVFLFLVDFCLKFFFFFVCVCVVFCQPNTE